MTIASPPRWTNRAAEIAFAPLHWVEQARGRKRLALLTLYAVVLAVVASLLWWSQSLNRLPDIGDPFDVEAFRSQNVADADNAFPLYLQASRGIKTLTNKPRRLLMQAIAGPWNSVPPEVSQALETHRQDLELWKQATKRPSIQVGESWDSIDPEAYSTIAGIQLLQYLAILEGSRLENQGDMAGASEWYAAVLRAENHIAASRLRGWGRGNHPMIPFAIGRWHTNPLVDTDLLRKALGELQAIDAARPSFASSLKTEYVHNLAELEQAQIAENQEVRTEDQWYKYMPGYSSALTFFKREPERSRRILRLIYANLIAHIDEPPTLQPKIVPPGVFDVSVDHSGKDIARRISPQDLENQIAKSLLPGYLLDGQGTIAQANREQMARSTMLLGMAAELYMREHGGKPPPTFNDLVGPYLKNLPAGAVGTEGPGAR